MRLGQSKKKRVLTPKLKKRLFRLGMTLFLGGIFLLAVSFRALPVLKMPLEHLDLSFTISFLMIPVGAILMMIGRMFYKMGYILALLVFLLASGGLAHFQMESYKTTNLDRCCKIFAENGCSIEELPSDFTLEVQQRKINCTSFTPGKKPYNWRSVCSC